MSVCHACGAKNPAQARFCNQCGAGLSVAAPSPRRAQDYTPRHLADKILKTRAAIQGEKKRVTVLFCDIKGSTKLAEQAGPERWHAVLDEFFALLSAAVHKYEGTVNQYTGDGIMALFGAPIAHEDHAQRACYAALEMQSELRKFADRLRLREGLNLTLRVGLNTGEVIVGRIGDDLRMDYTAQGLTVNLAARMEHICEPGHIYLTRATAALAEGYFRLRALGAMTVEGSSTPIEVFDLEDSNELRTRLQRGFARGTSPFIGRERERELLNSALARAKAGEGAVMAVLGNAGIGKSRLCHEFAEDAARAGFAVHRATGVPYAAALPLYPVQSLVRSRLGLPERCKPEDARRLVAGTFLLQDPAHAALVPAILEFLGFAAAGAAAPDAAAATREKMFEVLAAWLPQSDSPQLLLVEDAHFFDAASEDFLRRVAAAARGGRSLLLFNHRPDYINEWLIPHLDEQIALSALTQAQLLALTQALLGRDASLDGVAERIVQRANGNPYYAEEAVHALRESGYLEGERGHYRLQKAIGEWRIPDTVHALIAARIDRLPDEHKSLLQSAAVIGQEFRPELLAHLSQMSPEPFESSLAVLEETGFVNQKSGVAERHYQFCNPLMQEVAYQAQLEARRALAHARLAQTLESQHPASGAAHEVWLQIAHHWRRAGEWLKAGEWSLHAARYALMQDIAQAMTQLKHAESCYRRAEFSDVQRRGHIAALAGIVRASQFADLPADEVVAAYDEGLKLAQECGDVACIAEMKLSYGVNLLNRGDAAAAVRLTAEAVEVCKQNKVPQLVHRFRLAILLPFNAAGLPQEGIRLVDEGGGSEWRSAPITEENFASRAFYGLMLAWMGRFQEAEANLLGALEVAEREDRAASWMHSNLVDFAWFTGRYELALPHAREAIVHAEKFGSPYFTAVATRALGLAYGLNRDFATAARVMEPALKWVAPGAQAHQFEANFLATLSRAYLGLGQHERAAEVAQQAIASAQKSHSKVWEISGWVSLLNIPPTGPWQTRVAEGLARLDELIATTKAQGYVPWALLCRARSASDGPTRARLRAEAAQVFERMGATRHAERVRAA